MQRMPASQAQHYLTNARFFKNRRNDNSLVPSHPPLLHYDGKHCTDHHNQTSSNSRPPHRQTSAFCIPSPDLAPSPTPSTLAVAEPEILLKCNTIMTPQCRPRRSVHSLHSNHERGKHDNKSCRNRDAGVIEAAVRERRADPKAETRALYNEPGGCYDPCGLAARKGRAIATDIAIARVKYLASGSKGERWRTSLHLRHGYILGVSMN